MNHGPKRYAGVTESLGIPWSPWIGRIYGRICLLRSALAHTQSAVGALARAGFEGRQAGRAGRLGRFRIDDDQVGGVHRRTLFGIEPVEPVVVEQFNGSCSVVARDREPEFGPSRTAFARLRQDDHRVDADVCQPFDDSVEFIRGCFHYDDAL